MESTSRNMLYDSTEITVFFEYLGDNDLPEGVKEQYSVGYFTRYTLTEVYLKGIDILAWLSVKVENEIIDMLESIRLAEKDGF